MQKRLVLGLAALTLLLAGVSHARADLLGSTMSWQYYAYGGAYTFGGGTTSGTFVDTGSGVDGTFIGGTSFIYFNIESDATSITFDYSVATGSSPWSDSVLSLAPTIYNGIAIDMVSGPAFTSVSIDPATNMAGFGLGNISFTGSEIQVDWHLLPFDTSTIVKLDVSAPSGIPEPASMTLLGLGIAGVAGCAWRRRKKA
jgi:hypothetical protein